MKRILLLITTSAISLANFAQGCTDLYFSEYIEGSGNNKALEIYNPTNSSINLSNYSVELYANGAAAATSTLALSGTLSAGGVFVIIGTNTPIDAAIVAQKDTAHAVAGFNGDDAVALFKSAVQIDGIGVIGVRPTGSWTVGTGATKDYTLVRKATVNNGNTTWVGAGETEWDVNTIDNFTFLGNHTANGCGTAVTPLTVGISVNDNSVCLGTTINYTGIVSGGTAPYSTSINFGDGSSSATLTGSHTYITAGTFSIVCTATDNSNPSQSITSTTTVVVDPCSSINELKEKTALIYPNPSKDGLVSLSNITNNSTVVIFNVIGEVVYTTTANNNDQLNLNNLNKGSYFIKVSSKNNTVTKKLIIE